MILLHDVFRAFEAYPFDSDERFKAGVASVLASEHPDHHQEAVDQAKFFYYSKFITPFEYEEYARWKSNAPSSSNENDDDNTVKEAERPTRNADREKETHGKDQPPSFQDLVDMIQKGIPIPGIKEIPNTLAKEASSKATMSPRVKPWEREQKMDRYQKEAN